VQGAFTCVPAGRVRPVTTPSGEMITLLCPGSQGHEHP
jgi:hypothetical protein